MADMVVSLGVGTRYLSGRRQSLAASFHVDLAAQWMKLTRRFIEQPKDCCPYCAEPDQPVAGTDPESRFRLAVSRVSGHTHESTTYRLIQQLLSCFGQVNNNL